MRRQKLYVVKVKWARDGSLGERGDSYSRPKAEAIMRSEIKRFAKLAKEARARNDVKEDGTTYYDGNKFWIDEVDVSNLFQVPPKLDLRSIYDVRVKEVPNGEGFWSYNDIEVVHTIRNQVVGTYQRNYSSFYRTFEPFRQGKRDYALIAPRYMGASVMDLKTGKIIAEEDKEAKGYGFCPVGFYVPDWWDLTDGSIVPGSRYWDGDMEWVNGQLGFVWGCYWGDDTAWKLQCYDLSHITDGVIARDARFGYVTLAHQGAMDKKDFIAVNIHDGIPSVTLTVNRRYDLATGVKAKNYDEDM